MGSLKLYISALTYTRYKGLEVDLRGEIYNSIMLSGGTTLFPGFPTRLKNDLNSYLDEDIKAGRRVAKAIKVKIIVKYLHRTRQEERMQCFLEHH